MRALLCVCLVFFIIGCTSKQPKIPSAWFKPGVRVMLPSPGLDTPINEQQLLTAKVKGKSYSLIALLDVNQKQLSLAGLSSLGVRLFLVNYDKSGIHAEQSIMLPELPPAEQVLADIMLSYWPIARWSPQLPAGWTLTDKELIRELRDERQQLVSQINYIQTKGVRLPINIDNHVFGYQILISHLGVTP